MPNDVNLRNNNTKKKKNLGAVMPVEAYLQLYTGYLKKKKG